MKSFLLYPALAVALLAGTAHAQTKQPFSMNGNKPELNICTGKEGGGYHGVGNAVVERLKLDFVVNNIPAAGSLANLKGMLAVTGTAGAVAYRGKSYACHIVIVQEDALVAAQTLLPTVIDQFEMVRRLYPEPVLLITRDSDLDDLDEFVDTDNKIALVRDSGAEVTLNAFANLADRYRSVIGNIVYVNSWTEGLDRLGSKDVGGVFYVGAYTGNDGLTGEAHRRDYYFADVYSRHISKSDLYQRIELDIEDRWGDVDTTAVSSVVGVHKAVKDALISSGFYDLLYAGISQAVDGARGKIDVSRLDGWKYD